MATTRLLDDGDWDGGIPYGNQKRELYGQGDLMTTEPKQGSSFGSMRFFSQEIKSDRRSCQEQSEVFRHRRNWVSIDSKRIRSGKK